MKLFCKRILLFFFILSIFACTQKPAKILNRSKVRYGQNNYLNKSKYKNYDRSSKSSRNKTSKPSKIEIVAGDTLLSIAKKYEVTLRDLIKQNNLEAPYNLKIGSYLTIPAPNYHEVKKGDTLYSISRLYDMKIDDLIKMNDLQEPFGVRLGEKIRISKFNPNNKVAQDTRQQKRAEIKKDNKVGFVERVTRKFNKFDWPLKGRIVSQFGPKKGGLYNDGIKIKAKMGDEVKAAEDGVVAYVGNELKGYGNLIIIKHSGGWITAYAHLKSANVTRGQEVKQGQKIALVGASGNVSSPQLYFGLRRGRDAVNPQRYLR